MAPPTLDAYFGVKASPAAASTIQPQLQPQTANTKTNTTAASPKSTASADPIDLTHPAEDAPTTKAPAAAAVATPAAPQQQQQTQEDQKQPATGVADNTSTNANAANGNHQNQSENERNTALVQSLRKRIAELEAENASLKKKAATAALMTGAKVTAAAASAAAAGGGGVAARKPKTPAQKAKLFEKWSKALERAAGKEKFDGGDYMLGECREVVVKEGVPMPKEEFEELFVHGRPEGKLIQPTPQNKPTSVTTIISFATEEAMRALLGAAFTGTIDVNLFRKRSFQKAWNIGKAKATLDRIDVHYNKTKMALEVHGFYTSVANSYFC